MSGKKFVHTNSINLSLVRKGRKRRRTLPIESELPWHVLNSLSSNKVNLTIKCQLRDILVHAFKELEQFVKQKFDNSLLLLLLLSRPKKF